jgi:hypothetical protein
MRQLSDMEASEAALSWALLRHLCHAQLAHIVDGSAILFDHELRVRVAVGAVVTSEVPIVGQLLPDVMPAASWDRLRGPYEAALTGRRSTFDFVIAGKALSIDVSPIELPGEPSGALAVSRPISER